MNDFVKPSDKKNSNKKLKKAHSYPAEKKYIVITDEDGNIKGYFPIKKKNLGVGWIALYQNSSIWIAQQNLTGEQLRVMHVLFGKLDFENYLHIKTNEIAEILNIKAPNVSRAIRKLKELNIIIEEAYEGRLKTYRLNPHLAYKGSERNNIIDDFNPLLENEEATK